MNLLKGGAKCPEHIEDYKLAWRAMVEQKVPLVCFKKGSNEIIGANMLFVYNKDDHFIEKCYENVSLSNSC